MDEGVERLRASGFETPRLDSELLLAHAIGVERTAVVAHGDGAGRRRTRRRLSGVRWIDAPRGSPSPTSGASRSSTASPSRSTRGRSSRGRRPSAWSTSRCAEVMARLAARRAGGTRPLRVVDVGTGSGAIAIALAVGAAAPAGGCDEVVIVAVDVSADALDLARENAVGHGVGRPGAVRVRRPTAAPTSSRRGTSSSRTCRMSASDAMAALPAPTTFEPRARARRRARRARRRSRRLLTRCRATSPPDGVALLEIGADQGEATSTLVAERLPGWRAGSRPTSRGCPRRRDRAARRSVTDRARRRSRTSHPPRSRSTSTAR